MLTKFNFTPGTLTVIPKSYLINKASEISGHRLNGVCAATAISKDDTHLIATAQHCIQNMKAIIGYQRGIFGFIEPSSGIEIILSKELFQKDDLTIWGTFKKAARFNHTKELALSPEPYEKWVIYLTDYFRNGQAVYPHPSTVMVDHNRNPYIEDGTKVTITDVGGQFYTLALLEMLKTASIENEYKGSRLDLKPGTGEVRKIFNQSYYHVQLNQEIYQGASGAMVFTQQASQPKALGINSGHDRRIISFKNKSAAVIIPFPNDHTMNQLFLIKQPEEPKLAGKNFDFLFILCVVIVAFRYSCKK